MEAQELGSPTPTYHLLPKANQHTVKEDAGSPSQGSPETMQLKKEISLLNGRPSGASLPLSVCGSHF
uniref:Solute carrier family 7 (cationic amino acid transporter, y+ system), member 6 n=1 Tax=Mus musculus TaxID=10090 RepID=A0A1D5RMA4_MOUSE